MSIPAFAWAMKCARKLKLPTAERMLLVALADSLNVKTGQCNPGQEELSANTGLTARHIRDLVPKLVGLGLVEVQKRGRALCYHLCMDGARHAATPEPSSGIKQEQASPVKPEPASGNGRDDTGTWSPRYRNSVPKTPEPSSAQPFLEPGREPKEPPRSPPVAGGRRRAPKFRNGFHVLDGGRAAPTIEATADEMADFQAFHGRMRGIANG